MARTTPNQSAKPVPRRNESTGQLVIGGAEETLKDIARVSSKSRKVIQKSSVTYSDALKRLADR
jgi:hypothetical protein